MKKKHIDKQSFINTINTLVNDEEIHLVSVYENGHEYEAVFRKLNFIGEDIILYGYVEDFTIGVIQDTYSMTKKEMLELIWTEDLSDYDNRKVYVKID